MTINLTSAAVILWSGMLVIAGAVLILSSQVRHLVDILEARPEASVPVTSSPRRVRPVSTAGRARNAGPRVAAAGNARDGRRPLSSRQAA